MSTQRNNKRRCSERIALKETKRARQLLKYKFDFFSSIFNNKDSVQILLEYFPLDQWLLLRRTCKNLKHQIDKCKGTLAGNHIKKYLINNYGVSESLLQLIYECGGTISGSVILAAIYNRPLISIGTNVFKPDLDVFIHFADRDKFKIWISYSIESQWFVPDYNDNYGESYENLMLDEIMTPNDYKFSTENFPNKNELYNHNRNDINNNYNTKLQLIYLEDIKVNVNDFIDTNFDLSLLKNSYNGKKLIINHQNDILSQSFNYILKPRHLKSITSNDIFKRLDKYQDRGFVCRNFTIQHKSITIDKIKTKCDQFFIDDYLFACHVEDSFTRFGIQNGNYLHDILDILIGLYDEYTISANGLRTKNRIKNKMSKIIKVVNKKLGFRFPIQYLTILLSTNFFSPSIYKSINHYNFWL